MSDAMLALDQGTTASTALVFSHEGAVLGRAYCAINQSSPEPGWFEQDSSEIWKTNLRVMQDADEVATMESGDPGPVRELAIDSSASANDFLM